MLGTPGAMGPPPQGPINGSTERGQSMTPNYNFFFNHGGGLGSSGGSQGGGPGWMPPPPIQDPQPTPNARPPGGPARIPPPVQVPPRGPQQQQLPGWAGYLQWLQTLGQGSPLAGGSTSPGPFGSGQAFPGGPSMTPQMGGFGPNPSVTTFPAPSGPPLTAPQVQRNLLKFRGPMMQGY